MTEYTRENMPDDLRWLAENVSEWPVGAYGDVAVCVTGYPGSVISIRRASSENCQYYSLDQWQDARQTLGLDQLDVTEEEEEEWKRVSEKQQRYQDATGEDWIDEFARTATPDEFRGAMRFTIGKYNRRMGKKDELVKEIQKMRDYCNRWLEYENAM